MISMQPIPLEKIATISAGQSAPKASEFSNNGLPFVRAGSLESLLSGKSEGDLELVSEETAKRKKLKLYPKGAILFAKSGMSATKARIYVLKNPAYVVSHLATLIPNDKVNTEYLRLVLKKFPPSSLIKDPAYPAISLGDIQGYKVPLPENIDDQIRIAHLLGKVENLIAQRKQHLQQLDDFLKSVFLEMFGDPVRNEKEWIKKPFSELLANIDSGKSPKCEAREAGVDEWGVLKLGAVTGCTFKERESKALPKDVTPNAKDEVKSGDLLFSRKNTYGLVAACAYVFETRPKLLLPDLIFRFILKENAGMDPVFLWKLLVSDSQRKHIQALAGGAAGSMPNISKTNLKRVDLPVPPIDLQNRFSAIVRRVESIKGRYQKSLTDMEGLYCVLSQKAFIGELDLSSIPLPESKRKAVDIDPISIASDQALQASKTAIAQLNNFNDKHSAILKAIQDSSALTALETPALKAAREMAEQVSLWRTPLDELTNMSAVARATEALAASSSVQTLAGEITAINETSLLARQIADSLPQLDMGWLKEQQAMMDAATLPFTEMKKSMAALALPDETVSILRESGRAMQAALPNTADWMTRFPAPISANREDEDEPRYIFTRHDILHALSETTPLSLNRLMAKLAELEVITLQGYERIKKLVFELLNEGEIEQHYSDEDNSIALKALA